MSMQDALLTGLQTSAIGLIIVFLVLYILMLVLKIFEKIFYKPEKKVSEDKPQDSITQPSSTLPVEEDEDELIAVLTAAVAASLNNSTYNLKIKSYKRVNNANSAWNKAGVRETIDNRIN